MAIRFPSNAGMPHTKNPRMWSQRETEEHQAALCGENICYYCIKDMEGIENKYERRVIDYSHE